MQRYWFKWNDCTFSWIERDWRRRAECWRRKNFWAARHSLKVVVVGRIIFGWIENFWFQWLLRHCFWLRRFGHGLLFGATQAENQMQSRFFLNVVLRQSAFIFQLLSSKNQTLLIRRNSNRASERTNERKKLNRNNSLNEWCNGVRKNKSKKKERK